MKYFLFYMLAASSIVAQAVYNKSDSLICLSKFEIAKKDSLSKEEFSDIISHVSKSFINTPYKAFTLEQDEKESLIVDLSGLDCYTFIETVLAISRCIKQDKYDFKNYLSELEKTRYRQGKLTDYTSRLHYFTDWIYDNQQRGVLKDISKNIGGKKYCNNVFFMSKNYEKYKHLKSNLSYVKIIETIERKISSRDYFFIPKNKIGEISDKIYLGDLIGITTNIEGLDVAHTAIIIKIKGIPHLLHASTVSNKVEISKINLDQYLKRNKRHTGIIVVRPLEP